MSDTLARIDDYQQRINAFRPFGPDLLPMLRNYYRIGLTYTSTAIEGFSYTESETKILLEEGLTVGGRPLQDALAVTGHAKAYDPACSRRRLWLGEQLGFSKAGSFKRKR